MAGRRDPDARPPAIPCGPGWRAIATADGSTACDPYPDGVPSPCGPGLAHFPGEAGCEPIGRACPAGEWPEDLPSTGVYYVRPGATGDGTRDSPAGQFVVPGPSAAPVVIALARGVHLVPQLTLTVPTTIRGVCASDTTLRFSSSESNLAIFAPSIAGGPLAIEDVRIEVSGVGVGVRAENALTLRGVELVGARSTGVLALGTGDGARFDAEGVVVSGVGPDPSGLLGFGISLGADVQARLHRVIVEHVHAAGITGGSVALADVVVRDVQEVVGTGASAYGVGSTGLVTMSEVLVEGVVGTGVIAQGPTTMRDVLVRDVRWPAGDLAGSGVTVLLSGRLDARGLSITDVDRHGLVVVGPATARVEDLIVRDVRGPGPFSAGVFVGNTTLELARARVESATIGVLALIGGFVRVTDLSVEATWLGGVVAGRGSEIDLARGIVDAGSGAGIVADGRGSSIAIEDALVRATVASSDGTLGYGVAVQDHAIAELDRLWIDRSASVGLLVTGDRTRVVGADLVVASTGAPECACGGGVGVLLAEGARLAVGRTAVAGAAACGIELVTPSTLESHGAEVSDAPLGACGAELREGAPDARFSYRGTGAPTGSTAPALPVPFVVPEAR